MVNEKQTKEQSVASEPRPKYLCTEQKEKQATHSYNLRSKARQQQQQQIDGNNNSEEMNRNLGGAVKRAYDYVDTVETEDDSLPVAVGGRKSPAKKAKFIVTYKEMNDFFNLLKDQGVSEFLRRDACCLISDKVNFNSLLTSLILLSFFFLAICLVRSSHGLYLFQKSQVHMRRVHSVQLLPSTVPGQRHRRRCGRVQI